ncbi:alpha/beta fold hydrolase [Pontivivens insulae]|uniref:Soluble epoxide hydrolase n=1 Tax=Pontivivens insulae TaxID=1639689 RepID=A0A2R8AB71_9RHOB|nr:alpha/beta hydrolase [Pontivivens insulae]RED11345.1 pimeloyl-ACP methyl ester carboxylesterase [Pontivivens insulae]SPF29482.1 Soluble epoxide hydrolase [Pontivivens insulae]
MIEEHRVMIDGAPTRVLTSGPTDGSPLILLHGFPEMSLAFTPLMDALKSFRCIAFDQRGFGISRNPAPDLKGFAMPALLSDLHAIADAFELRSFSLLGHDWGAAVAYAAAFAMPERVERLIVMNGVHPVCFQRALSAGGPQSEASAYIDWLRADGVEDVLRADGFARLLGLFAAHMDMGWLEGKTREMYLAEWARPRALEGMVSWYRVSPVEVAAPGQPRPLPDWAKADLQVRMPHLLIWGQNDTALLPEATEGLEGICHDLTRVTLPDCDHWLHHQRPEAVAAAITSWLDP